MTRRTAIPAIALVIGAALLVAGCGDDDGVRTIDAADDGSAIELAEGDLLDVELEANPTTGYEWTVVSPGPLEFRGESHVVDDPDADGSGGVTTLRFAADATGTGELLVVYHQPWDEETQPADTFTVGITVSP